MSHLVEDMKKFRELLNKTPTQLNEMFSFNQKKGGQTVPPQDKLGIRSEKGIAKHPEEYKDMMTNPKMDHVKKAYAAGGPKGTLPEDDNKAFMKDIVDEGDELEEAEAGAVQAITPIYQQVQGLVPSFKEPTKSYLLQAQKALRAAIDAAQGGQVNEETLTEVSENKQEFIDSFTKIKNGASALLKGQTEDQIRMNIGGSVRNELWDFLKWMERSYGVEYADQVWDHLNLGDLRKDSYQFEHTGRVSEPTEDYLHDALSTMTMLIKYLQKLKEPA